MTDTELTRNIKNNKEMEESIAALLSNHAPLITRMTSKYIKPLHDSGCSIEEIINERSFIIYKAAMSFNEEKKTKFSTYLGSYVRWYCLNRINKNKNEDWKHVVDYPIETLPEEQADNTVIEYIHHLLDVFEDKKIKKVFELRYFSGGKLMSWGEIAGHFNVSGQAVINWHNKGLKLLNARASGNYIQ